MLTVRLLMLNLLEVIVPIVISCANTENDFSHLMLYNNVLYFFSLVQLTNVLMKDQILSLQFVVER